MVALPSEDVGAVVIDMGNFETRAGFAGEDTPKVSARPSDCALQLTRLFCQAVYPSLVGLTEEGDDVKMTGAGGEGDVAERSKWKVGAAELSYRRDGMEVRSPFDGDGIPSDQTVVQALLGHALEGRLRCNVREHPLLLSEPSWNTSACREATTELVFERFGTPGLFMSKTAVLSTFMNARASAVVLDVGHAWSSAVPVHEGYVLRKCIQRSPVAGQRIQQDLLEYLERQAGGHPVQPQYACSRKVDAEGVVRVSLLDFPRTHPSYRRYAVSEVVRDLKECVCRVSETDYSDAEYEKVAAVPYELPDGRVVQMGAQRFKSPELLFKPDLYSHVTASAAATPGPDGSVVKGMHELVYAAIQQADADLRKELWNSICVAGGTSLMPGFKERLERDLTNISPAKVRVTAAAFTVERKFSAWIGGSILASLGTFQQMWISKAEYEEHGSSIVEKKCP